MVEYIYYEGRKLRKLSAKEKHDILSDLSEKMRSRILHDKIVGFDDTNNTLVTRASKSNISSFGFIGGW